MQFWVFRIKFSFYLLQRYHVESGSSNECQAMQLKIRNSQPLCAVWLVEWEAQCRADCILSHKSKRSSSTVPYVRYNLLVFGKASFMRWDLRSSCQENVRACAIRCLQRSSINIIPIAAQQFLYLPKYVPNEGREKALCGSVVVWTVDILQS